jgi:anti-sigma factor RsiW
MASSMHSIEQEELMAYFDGELPADRATLMAAHLEQCAECGAWVAESRSVSERLTDWQVEAAPLSLTERVTAAIPAGELKKQPGETTPVTQPRPRLFGLPRWVWAAAGAVCLFLMIAAVSTPNLHRSRVAANLSLPVYQNGETAVYPAMQTRAYSPPPASLAPARARGTVGGVPGGVRTGEIGSVAEGSLGKLVSGGSGGGEMGTPITGPMIARTASLKLLTKDFDKTRAALEEVVQRHRGYSAQLVAGSGSNGARTFSANFRVPADQLDAAIAEIKPLAHVEQESQGGEEVTEQYVDLTARLSNAHRTEQQLLDVLEKRTGRLSDVLDVERELARVREEIEQMEAQLKSLQNRVSFATLRVELREEYKAELEMTPPSIGGRLRNAVVEGYRNAVDSLVGVVMFLLSVGPFLLLWALLLFFPARYVWRRVHEAIDRK